MIYILLLLHFAVATYTVEMPKRVVVPQNNESGWDVVPRYIRFERLITDIGRPVC
jgi:hypothetical protein